jgi:hypothetical protein
VYRGETKVGAGSSTTLLRIVQGQVGYRNMSKETISKMSALLVGVVQIGIAGLYFGYNEAVAERSDLKISEFSIYAMLGIFALAVALLSFAWFAISEMMGGFCGRLLGLILLVVPLFIYWRILNEKQILYAEDRLFGMVRYVSAVEVICFCLLSLTLIAEGIAFLRTVGSGANYKKVQGIDSGS